MGAGRYQDGAGDGGSGGDEEGLTGPACMRSPYIVCSLCGCMFGFFLFFPGIVLFLVATEDLEISRLAAVLLTSSVLILSIAAFLMYKGCTKQRQLAVARTRGIVVMVQPTISSPPAPPTGYQPVGLTDSNQPGYPLGTYPPTDQAPRSYMVQAPQYTPVAAGCFGPPPPSVGGAPACPPVYSMTPQDTPSVPVQHHPSYADSPSATGQPPPYHSHEPAPEYPARGPEDKSQQNEPKAVLHSLGGPVAQDSPYQMPSAQSGQESSSQQLPPPPYDG